MSELYTWYRAHSSDVIYCFEVHYCQLHSIQHGFLVVAVASTLGNFTHGTKHTQMMSYSLK